MRANLGNLVRTTFFVYIFIAALLFLCTVVLIGMLSNRLIEDILESETSYFWEYSVNYPTKHIIKSRSINSYFQDNNPSPMYEPVPKIFKELSVGSHVIENGEEMMTVMVSEKDNERLYLTYKHNVLQKVLHKIYLYQAVVFLLFMLILYIISVNWLIKMINPIIKMVNELGDKGENSDIKLFDHISNSISTSPEIGILSTSLSRLLTRVRELIDRERTFTRDASHEMRTALTVMKFSIEDLEEEQQLTNKGQESTQRIARSVKNLEELINGLLLMARDTEHTYENERVYLSEVMKDVIEQHGPLLKANKNKVSTLFLDETIVNAPPKAVSILLTNLFTNAVKYTHNGIITVELKDREVIIKDTGRGIAKDKLQKVFDVFHRAHDPNDLSGSSPKVQGFGVGLAIVKRLSERFNWKVDIQSELNKGTIVKVKF